MPWKVVPNSSSCPSSKPFAVVKVSSNKKVGCHTSRKKANAQLAALNASENKDKNGKGNNMAVRQKADLKNFSMDGVEPRGPASLEEAGSAATITVKLDAKELEDAVVKEQSAIDAPPVEEKSAHNPIHWLPFGVTSFAEIEQFEDARDAAFEVAEKSNLFPQLVENIMADENITDKSAAVSKISAEFGKFVQAKMNKVADGDSDHDDDETKQTSESSWLVRADQKIDKAIGRFATKLSDAFSLNGKNTNLNSDENGSLVIWKQNDLYRWLAVYSNNYRDVEKEIISAKSHERFVDFVDKGIFPMPVLRHFHVEGTDWGQAEMVHYDKDTGFAIAAGYVLSGHEHEAEAIIKMDDIALSHGMPKESVKRDPTDALVYIEHQTIEISDLPLEDAANKLTNDNFHIIKEADKMGLPDNKKAYLEKVGVKDISGLEKNLAKGKTLAQSLNLDSKQEGEDASSPVETPPVEPAVVPEVTPPAEAPVVADPAPAVEPVTEPVPVETPAADPASVDPVPAKAPAAPEATPLVEATPEPIEPTEAPTATPPLNGESAEAVGSFSETQTKELTDALKAITTHLLTEIDARLDAKLNERLAPVVEQLNTGKEKSDAFEKTILGQTPLAAIQEFIINPTFLNDKSALTSPSASLGLGDEALAKESGPAEAIPKETVINSGNPFTDNIAHQIVDQEWMRELKAPKASKVPARTPADVLA